MDVKKILAVATAVVGTVAMADIVSSSVVGYQTLDGNEGYTFVTPTFDGVSTSYSIQDVKIIGANVTGEGAQSLQILDSEGNVQDEDYYGWYNAGEAYKNSPAGWFDGNFDAIERPLDLGQAFLLSNDDGEYTIQFSGKVVFTSIPAYECAEGYTSVGNITPIAKDIQKFALAGENVTGEGAQSLQILDSEGNVPDEDYYGWYNAGEAYKNSPTGWYDGNFDLAVRDIEPGQSFLISNDDGESTISIPGVDD